MKLIITSILLSFFTFQNYASSLVTYIAPEHAEAAPEFELEINGQPVFVYNTRCAAFAYFSFEGKVDVKVTFLSPVFNFDIRPKSRKIVAEQYRNQIRFSLDKPENLSVEINKNIKRPLFIFANPLETNVPDKADKNVIFFEKGKIHYPGEVLIKSNQSVYIEGGAIVRGHFMTDKGQNIKILGRGILDNSRYLKGEHRPIEINQCENVLIEGIILAESRHWSCASTASKYVTYNNLKNVTFRNCDLIHTEGPEGTFTIHNGDRAVVKNVLYEDIRVEDSKGWLIDFKILQSQYSK